MKNNVISFPTPSDRTIDFKTASDMFHQSPVMRIKNVYRMLESMQIVLSAVSEIDVTTVNSWITDLKSILEGSDGS